MNVNVYLLANGRAYGQLQNAFACETWWACWDTSFQTMAFAAEYSLLCALASWAFEKNTRVRRSNISWRHLGGCQLMCWNLLASCCFGKDTSKLCLLCSFAMGLCSWIVRSVLTSCPCVSPTLFANKSYKHRPQNLRSQLLCPKHVLKWYALSFFARHLFLCGMH